jgi:phenylpyruvate tautomerase PptA (4-oxalocrotonate tautomerase family)
MPLLRITYQRGAITDSQKLKLAEELTPVLLVGEVGTDSQDGRDASFVLFHEIDARSEWFVSGKPDLEAPKGGRFLLEIWYLEGAATQSEKSEVHSKMNDILSDVLGVDGTFPNRMKAWWVIINEVTEGTWGAGGSTVGIEAANEALGGKTDRAEYYERHLKARQKLIDTNGFPTERS